MGRKRKTVPTLCIDRTRNRAYVRWDGRFLVMGPAPDGVASPQATLEYGQFVSRISQNPGDALSGRKQTAGSRPAKPVVTVNRVCLKFGEVKLPRYVTASGDESAEGRCYRGVLRLLRSLFGATPAEEFGPLRARMVRDEMIGKGWSRKFINKQMVRLRQIFRVAGEYELIPATVLVSLKTLSPLRPGDRNQPVPPVSAAPPPPLSTAVNIWETFDVENDFQRNLASL